MNPLEQMMTARAARSSPGSSDPASVTSGSREMSVLEAVDSGDRGLELDALHRRLALALDDPKTPPSALPGLTRAVAEVRREQELLRDESVSVVERLRVVPDEPWDLDGI